MQPYDYVHLWVGTNHTPEDDYLAYFAVDYSTEGDLESPDYQICGFCKDIGQLWYDEDFIGIIPRFENDVSLDEVLVEAAVNASEKENVKAICAKLNIATANAIFWYADSDLTIPEPKKRFNGLFYIGMFLGD